MASKDQLRRELLARRRALPPVERAARSAVICERVLASVDLAAVRTLHVYRAVPTWGEVQTEPLVERIRAGWPQIEIVSPGIEKEQPIPGRPFDLILVPVLGFDRDCYRLGLGGGFYDRFLAGQASATTVGLAYDWAFVPEGLPREEHDVPLDRIVTDGETPCSRHATG